MSDQFDPLWTRLGTPSGDHGRSVIDDAIDKWRENVRVRGGVRVFVPKSAKAGRKESTNI